MKRQQMDLRIFLLKSAARGESQPRCESPYYDSFIKLMRVESFRKEIQILNPNWQVQIKIPAYKHKEDLLALAKAGGNRPQRGTAMGNQLNGYTNQSQNIFDPAFNTEIRKIVPHWFFNHKERIEHRNESGKNEIRNLVKSGGLKPQNDSFYWRIIKKDSIFEKEIKELAPHWFVKDLKSDQTKQELLEMARKGEPKPKIGTCLVAWSLSQYVSKKSSRYDPKFVSDLKRLAPKWFSKSGWLISEVRKPYIGVKTTNNKNRLMDLAKSGGEVRGTDRMNLIRYSAEKSPYYDVNFTSEIRKLAPHWLLKKTDRTKQAILDLAKRDSSGTANIHRFINKNSRYYDSVFEAELRELAPHWFKKA